MNFRHFQFCSLCRLSVYYITSQVLSLHSKLVYLGQQWMTILYLTYRLSHLEVYSKGPKVCICYSYKGLLWTL